MSFRHSLFENFHAVKMKTYWGNIIYFVNTVFRIRIGFNADPDPAF
jgi:hypothetical protein